MKNQETQKDCGNKYIDLHVHLDGSVTTAIAKRLAEVQGMELPAADEEELKSMLQVADDCESLNEFLKCFELPISLMQTKEAISEAVYLVLEDMKKDGVIYVEVMFAPQFHTSKGLTQEDVILAAMDGLKRSDIHANLLLCLMRGSGNEGENQITLELAHKYLVEDGGIVGLNLAGAEALYPTKNYRTYFEQAKKWKIPFSIHAGEADGAQSVKAALEMGASRIGHGVRAVEDAEVLEMLKESQVVVEMCPNSNRLTKAVVDMSQYPFMDYLNYGIKATIHTDDPAVVGTTIAEEFQYMERQHGLTSEQRQMALANAIDGAFTSERVKEELRAYCNI